MVNVIETEKGLQTESGLIIPKGCYQWGKGVFTTSYEAICAIIKENSNNVLYYNNVESWRLEVILPLRYQQQKAFIESFFFPLLDKEDTLLEIGCAEGEWTFLISPYVKAIQAYDFSHRLIQNARHKLADSDITNITFMEGDICTMEIQDTYRVISFMGVLSCIIDWEQTKLIVKKLYKALAGGGYMIWKDNTNPTKEDYYFFGGRIDYWMVARSREKYIALFKEVGFQIVHEKVIHQELQKVEGMKVESESYMCILQKIRE